MTITNATGRRQSPPTRADRISTDERHLETMEAIHRMAGGIAHDFNSLLTAISGYAELAMEDLEAGRPVEGHLAEIRRTTRRAADLAGQLLAFSRRHVLDPKPTAVNELLVGLEDLLRCLLGRRVTLEVRPEGGLSPVFADRGQLERVLVNLALNARDAMPGGGELVLRTANAEIVMGEPNPGGAPAPGRYVTVTVSDTGMGIPAHVLPRIFEPFFTTKEPGKGVGLGLATVAGIVERSGGTIRVDTAVGRGSTFTIYLPACVLAADAVQAGPAAA